MLINIITYAYACLWSLKTLTHPQVSSSPSAATSQVNSCGGGLFKIRVKAKSAYYLKSGVNKKHAHKTGRPLPTEEEEEGKRKEKEIVVVRSKKGKKKNKKRGKEPDFQRGALIFGTSTVGEQAFPDFAPPSSFESEFIHYTKSENGEITWILPPKKAPEEEDRIDTTSTDVPEIPHGPVSKGNLSSLQKLKKAVVDHGTMLFTTIPETETQSNRENIKEAQENMMANKLSNAKIRPLNDFIRFRPNEAESKFIRKYCTKVARAIAAEIGVPGAETMEVYSVRYVEDPAEEFHIDRRGYGPGVMVVVLSSTSDYELVLARIKAGFRQTGIHTRHKRINRNCTNTH